MGLKQDIVIVNEFSLPTPSGGTRGATPGSFVLRYMARNGACEDMAPIRREDNDEYIRRYMARREATEAYDSVARVRDGVNGANGLGGVAFGSTGNDDIGDVSMSDAKVRRVSKDIQKQFDEGHTVLKTVLSFDLDYLKKHDIVDEDFEPKKRGDYRGNIDQMKLRMAIMNGMDKMSTAFDDLEWVGCIQVDTMHVHCHLCMADKGVGNIMPDGKQRGKIDEMMKGRLRRGIDMSLDEMQTVPHLAASVAYDRRNARCFIKKFTHEMMATAGTPQLLMACLPEDRTMWRASTNRKEMKKANAIVREYVREVLEEPDSGYREALMEIDAYANERRSREDLTGADYRRLIDDGKDRLMRECMDGVYQVLKSVPDNSLRVRTPMLDIMSMDYEDMASKAQDDDFMEFGFKLRSYSSRLDYHRKERQKYRDAYQEYEDNERKGNVGEASHVLYDFYRIEEEYNARLMAKYQHFLAFLPPDEEYEDEFNELMDYRRRMRRLRDMMNDTGMARRSETSAEDYGQRVYGQSGGHFMVTAPEVLDRRYDLMGETFNRMCSDFQSRLDNYGLRLEMDEKGGRVANRPVFPFDDVKALDLHHLSYDFPYDADVSKVNVDKFLDFEYLRYTAYTRAVDYLESTGQGDFVKRFPSHDVQLMHDTAEAMRAVPAIKSARTEPDGRKHHGATVRLDDQFGREIKLAVQQVVQSQRIEQLE